MILLVTLLCTARAMWRDVACDGKHTRGSVAGASNVGRIVRAFDIKGAAFDLTCSGLDQFSCGNRSPTKSRQALST